MLWCVQYFCWLLVWIFFMILIVLEFKEKYQKSRIMFIIFLISLIYIIFMLLYYCVWVCKKLYLTDKTYRYWNLWEGDFVYNLWVENCCLMIFSVFLVILEKVKVWKIYKCFVGRVLYLLDLRSHYKNFPTL